MSEPRLCFICPWPRPQPLQTWRIILAVPWSLRLLSSLSCSLSHIHPHPQTTKHPFLLSLINWSVYFLSSNYYAAWECWGQGRGAVFCFLSCSFWCKKQSMTIRKYTDKLDHLQCVLAPAPSSRASNFMCLLPVLFPMEIEVQIFCVSNWAQTVYNFVSFTYYNIRSFSIQQSLKIWFFQKLQTCLIHSSIQSAYRGALRLLTKMS